MLIPIRSFTMVRIIIIYDMFLCLSEDVAEQSAPSIVISLTVSIIDTMLL